MHRALLLASVTARCRPVRACPRATPIARASRHVTDPRVTARRRSARVAARRRSALHRATHRFRGEGKSAQSGKAISLGPRRWTRSRSGLPPQPKPMSGGSRPPMGARQLRRRDEAEFQAAIRHGRRRLDGALVVGHVERGNAHHQVAGEDHRRGSRGSRPGPPRRSGRCRRSRRRTPSRAAGPGGSLGRPRRPPRRRAARRAPEGWPNAAPCAILLRPIVTSYAMTERMAADAPDPADRRLRAGRWQRHHRSHDRGGRNVLNAAADGGGDRPGAGGVIAAEFVARRAGWAHAAACRRSKSTCVPAHREVPYDPKRSFRSIIRLRTRHPRFIASAPTAASAHAEVMRAGARRARADRWRLGVATLSHSLFMLLERPRSGVPARALHWRRTRRPGASAGQIDLGVLASDEYGTLNAGGQIRPIAVASGERALSQPAVPTLKELWLDVQADNQKGYASARLADTRWWPSTTTASAGRWRRRPGSASASGWARATAMRTGRASSGRWTRCWTTALRSAAGLRHGTPRPDPAALAHRLHRPRRHGRRHGGEHPARGLRADCAHAQPREGRAPGAGRRRLGPEPGGGRARPAASRSVCPTRRMWRLCSSAPARSRRACGPAPW